MRRWNGLLLAPLGMALAMAGCRDQDAARPDLSAYCLDSTGVALDGYSPVSCVDAGVSRRGDAAYSVAYRGITYRFVDAEEKAAFAAHPERYEPQCGGWCAYGLTVGIRWKPAPDNFKLVDGRLYLFSRTGAADARRLWDREPDEAALVRRADEYWRSLRSD